MADLRYLLTQAKPGKVKPRSSEAVVRGTATEFARELKAITPPVDLSRFLRARSIVQVSHVDMPEDGALYALDSVRLAVDLRRANSEARNRFTCGHEIAHTFFLDRSAPEWHVKFRIVESDIERPAAQRGDGLEEHLCNVFAGELLIPSPFLQNRIRSRGFSWRTMLEMSEETRCSVTACAVRSIQSGWTRSLLLCWKPLESSKHLRLAWQLASPGTSWRIDPSVPPPQDSQVYRAFSASTRRVIQSGKLKLPLPHGGSSDVYAESWPSRNSVLTLVVLERGADVLGSNAAHWTRGAEEQLRLF